MTRFHLLLYYNLCSPTVYLYIILQYTKPLYFRKKKLFFHFPFLQITIKIVERFVQIQNKSIKCTRFQIKLCYSEYSTFDACANFVISTSYLTV